MTLSIQPYGIVREKHIVDWRWLLAKGTVRGGVVLVANFARHHSFKKNSGLPIEKEERINKCHCDY